ncbi:CHAT domain-containing protein [Actinophytocola glycyrrhizae]|uniref:CHAT domain-containing protein n=1 Tax=Actinophytocola glycyrrhizae TaxID=2044873 RepID=A0ABV9SA59_9PSEU
MIQYDELRIRAFRIGPHRYFVVANGPTSAAAVVRIGPEQRFGESFARLLDEEFRRAERLPAPMHERVRDLGQQLFTVLFPDPLRACLFESARRAVHHDRCLRIRFELPPELGELPVEILCPPFPERRLTGDSRFSLTRSVPGSALSPRRLPAPTSRPERFRVLVVAAESRTGRVLNLGSEVAALRDSLNAGPRRAAVTVETLGGPGDDHKGKRPTLANLRAALARHPEMPSALILLGHGVGGDGNHGGQVYLEGRDGQPEAVAGERLATEVATAPNVRLVVLNLCAGARHAAAEHLRLAVADELVARGIPAVVAMQADVSDGAASRFTPTLFAELAANRSLDEAMAIARHDMVNTRDETTLEWATPVLVLHEQARHSWLFKAVKVVKGTVPGDPLADGQRATEEVDDPPDGVVRLEALVEASRFARVLGDWSQVVRFADMGREEHPEPLEWLAQEARLELAMTRCHAICELLAGDDDPARAEAVLDGLGLVVPEQVVDCLAQEMRLATKARAALEAARRAADAADWEPVVAYCDEVLAEWPDGYRDTRALREMAVAELDLDARYGQGGRRRETGDWHAAVEVYAAIVELRPDGYRDAARWRDYCRGRQLESEAALESAIDSYKASGGVADASGRAAHCQAWQADRHEDWATATTYYEAAAHEGLDVGPDLPYARGRRSLALREFAEAAHLLGALPEQYRDAHAWARFAEGQVAFAATEWGDVLDALSRLPAEFGAGEVGRLRALARARLAVEREDWAAVIEALQDVEDVDDDEVRVVRLLARWRLAEDRGDWSAVVAEYEQVRSPSPEHTEWLHYATGRIAEKAGDFGRAFGEYERVTDAVRDVVPRRVHVMGRQAEEALNWVGAEHHFGQLPPEFEDSGRLAGYARARSATEREDWPVVVQNAGALGSFRDAPVLGRYGRARLAESEQDWSRAADLFGECSGHADADVRADYARGRSLAADGRWREALARYDTVPDGHLDVSDRRARLTELLGSFGWAERLVAAGLEPDPSAADRPDFPYRVLAALGVGPAASVQQVKDAEIRAMQESAPAAVRVAAGLRSWPTRLGLDADLYPVRDPAGLRRVLGAVTDGEPDDLFGRMCEAAVDAPLLTLLHVGREQAIEAWEQRMRADPADLGTAHCLAIAHRWAARDLDGAGAWEHGRMAWHRCIGMWVTVLGDEDYWERWRRERSTTYHFMVPVAEVRQLRQHMVTGLADELTGAADWHDAAGRPRRAEQYRMLGLAVRTEVVGREVAEEVGGLPTPGRTDEHVVGGPEYVRATGLAKSVAELAAGLVRRRDAALSDSDAVPGDAAGGISDEQVSRFCAAFSRLAPAQALLESGRPERALAMLPPTRGRRLADSTSCDCAKPAGDETCASCRRFRGEDPAYLRLGGREARLFQDAALIAMRCHLKAARSAVLGDDERGVDVAVAAVEAVVELASAAGLAVRARRDLVDFVGTTVETMVTPRSARPRIGRAVDLATRVRTRRGLANDETLRRIHAGALCDRAQWSVAAEELEHPDYDSAIADLREAIRLSPTLLRAREGLAHTLVQRSVYRLHWANGHEQSLAEALTVASEGLRLAPGMARLLEVVEAVASQVRGVVYRTLTEAELMELRPPAVPADGSRADTASVLVREARCTGAAGDRRAALLLAVDAVLADPGDQLTRDTLADLLAGWTAGRTDDRSTT